jgi:hypothetical protein|tara:strand:+ start:104 stop:388 length:285 start_codon:yes stop_codon:yes gene_type:complete
MTDLSSEEQAEQDIITSLVGDVMDAKMELAANQGGMHRLRLGVFEMEIVPDDEDIRPFMKDMVKLLHKLYAEEVLKARILHDEKKNHDGDRMIQ